RLSFELPTGPGTAPGPSFFGLGANLANSVLILRSRRRRRLEGWAGGSAPLQRLQPARQLGPHHLLPVQPAAVDDEGAVAHGVARPLLPAVLVVVGGNAFEHDDAVSLDEVHHAAFDVRHAFLDERRADMPGLQGGEAEPLELVGVAAR